MADDNSTTNKPPIPLTFSSMPQLMEAIRKGEYTPRTRLVQNDGSPPFAILPAKEQPFLHAIFDILASGPRQSKSDAGYVYLVLCGGRYKIGKSKNVKKRITGLQFPPTAQIICTIKSEQKSKLETSLHKRFADKREEGEWFKLNAADVVYIKGLAESAD